LAERGFNSRRRCAAPTPSPFQIDRKRLPGTRACVDDRFHLAVGSVLSAAQVVATGKAVARDLLS